jgi:hypothetical protein
MRLRTAGKAVSKPVAFVPNATAEGSGTVVDFGGGGWPDGKGEGRAGAASVGAARPGRGSVRFPPSGAGQKNMESSRPAGWRRGVRLAAAVAGGAVRRGPPLFPEGVDRGHHAADDRGEQDVVDKPAVLGKQGRLGIELRLLGGELVRRALEFARLGEGAADPRERLAIVEFGGVGAGVGGWDLPAIAAVCGRAKSPAKGGPADIRRPRSVAGRGKLAGQGGEVGCRRGRSETALYCSIS